MDTTIVAEKWIDAIIVRKITEESKIELKVDYYPEEIPFEEYYIYHQSNTSPCWQNLNHNDHSPDYIIGGKLSIINSNDELVDYFICPDDYPAVDFSKHTLLLSRGTTKNGIAAIRNIFFKIDENQYIMNVTIRESISHGGGMWIISILIPKIANAETVILDIENI